MSSSTSTNRPIQYFSPRKHRGSYNMSNPPFMDTKPSEQRYAPFAPSKEAEMGQLKCSKTSRRPVTTSNPPERHHRRGSSTSPSRNQPSHPRQKHSSRSLLSDHTTNWLKNEPSSSTTRSHYDRKASPLAISQQTSASSARDFALKKGRLSAMSTPFFETTHSLEVDSDRRATSRNQKKRPGRLDLANMFPKPSSKSGPILSPRRRVDSPPPLSMISGGGSKELGFRSYAYHTETTPVVEEDDMVAQTAGKLAGSVLSTDEETVQGHGLSPRDWLDDVGMEAENDDADPGPEMQADFIENAFQAGRSKMAVNVPAVRDARSEKNLRAKICDRRQVASPVSVKSSAFRPNSQLCWGSGGVSRPRSPYRHPTSISTRSTTPSIATANLYEESILCSSSDDEDEGIPPPAKRAPEVGRVPGFMPRSYQSGHASFFQSLDALNHPQVRDRPLTASATTRLSAAEIPKRSSSKQKVSQLAPDIYTNRSHSAVPKASAFRPLCHELSSKRSATGAGRSPLARQDQPRLMALTSQEASLLEAIRSKKILMQHRSPSLYSEDMHPDSASVPWMNNAAGYVTSEERSLRPDSRFAERTRQTSVGVAPTESSLPSGQASLIYSESLSSPTTGRDSPATPVHDPTQDLRVFHDFEDRDRSPIGFRERRPRLDERRADSSQLANFDVPSPIRKAYLRREDPHWTRSPS